MLSFATGRVRGFLSEQPVYPSTRPLWGSGEESWLTTPQLFDALPEII